MFGSAAEAKARGEAARAGHGNSTGMGGGNGGRSYDSRAANSRYSQNTIATRPATFGNIAQALVGGLPGPGMIAKAGMMIGGYDPYSGPVRHTTGYSYDPKNMAGMSNPGNDMSRFGSFQLPYRKQAVQPMRPAGAPAAQAPTMPGMTPLTMAPGQINIPGPSQYSVNLPSYGYFGTPPALQRPKSAILGGI